MNISELPVTFECAHETLVGIIHVPDKPASRGILAMPAGGPQYRAGCCRQLLYLGRRLAAEGTPVMRFDYRGLGDGSGQFSGFTTTETDIRSAIETFRKNVPELHEIVLWGGCDAASASMMHGWKLPGVTGLVLGNPFSHSEETGEQALVKHYYLQRLREPAFWKKLLSLRFNPLPALATVARVVKRKFAPSSTKTPGEDTQELDRQPFQIRMRVGVERLAGHVLLLMSGRSLVSKEFDELLTSDPIWAKALGACASLTRHDLPEADQAFSTVAARDEVIEIAARWLATLPPATKPLDDDSTTSLARQIT